MSAQLTTLKNKLNILKIKINKLKKKFVSEEESLEQISSKANALFLTGSFQVAQGHLDKFIKIEKILKTGSVDEKATKLNTQGLQGYVHLDSHEWPNRNDLMSALQSGVEYMRFLFKEKGNLEAIKIINGTSNPCFFAVLDNMQASLTPEILFEVTFDPKHNHNQRIGELIRVYKNIHAKIFLESYGINNPSNDDIKNILANTQKPPSSNKNYADLFFDRYMTVDKIMTWALTKRCFCCRNNIPTITCKNLEQKYIGYGSPSVKQPSGSGSYSADESKKIIIDYLSNL